MTKLDRLNPMTMTMTQLVWIVTDGHWTNWRTQWPIIDSDNDPMTQLVMTDPDIIVVVIENYYYYWLVNYWPRRTVDLDPDEGDPVNDNLSIEIDWANWRWRTVTQWQTDPVGPSDPIDPNPDPMTTQWPRRLIIGNYWTDDYYWLLFNWQWPSVKDSYWLTLLVVLVLDSIIDDIDWPSYCYYWLTQLVTSIDPVLDYWPSWPIVIIIGPG